MGTPATVPIPQGATLEPIQQAQAAPATVPIPQGARLEALPQSAQPAFKPGIAEGVSGAVGAPSTPDELTAAEEEARAHPIKNIVKAGTPAWQIFDMAKSYIENVYNRGKEAFKEAKEAGENIGKGEPVAPNIAKAALPAYQTINAAIPGVGEQANKVGEDVAKKNYGAAIGRGVTTIALAGIGGKEAGAETPKPGEAIAKYRAGSQVSTMREAANLHPNVVLGTEEVIRAAAPTGSNPQFRSNAYAAAGDLAEIGRKIDLSESKGGMIRPDMRVRATVDAINDHLQDMYQTERAPQIAKHSEAPVNVDFGTDANEGLQYLSRRAGQAEDRAIAASGMKDGTIPLRDADRLAMIVNQELKGFESMTPAERAASSMTNRKMASLKALDRQLGGEINSVLTANGEVGLKDYERRYAALSEVRDQLSTRMNAVELHQPGAIKGVVQPIAKVLTGGPSGVASASQAAVADVNIGRMLQSGLKRLAKSDLQPKRSISPTANPQ